MASIVKAVQNCCPWFFPSSIIEYQKRMNETEQESFMKDTIQPSNNGHHHAHHHTHHHPHHCAHHEGHHSTNQVINHHQDHHHTHISKKKKEYNYEDEDKKQVEFDNEWQKIEYQSPTNQSSSTLLSQSITEKISYIDCINTEHPYYSLLYSKLEQLPGIFDLQAEPQLKIAQNQYNLKILIKQTDDQKLNIFVYSFVFPTTYQFYEQMQNNFELQKSFDTNIDCYECQQKLDDYTRVVYLAYKKILIVSPRDFVYVLYRFKKNDQNWTVITSIPDAETREGKTRANIIMTATRAIQKDGKLQIIVYSQIDMKIPVKASAAKVRGITEIKKYLDKCYQYVQKQKNNII